MRLLVFTEDSECKVENNNPIWYTLLSVYRGQVLTNILTNKNKDLYSAKKKPTTHLISIVLS